MKRLHLIGLESIETRYTKEWRTHLPEVLGVHFEVFDNYYGDILDASVKASDFLNWTSTNYFKSSQLMKFCAALQNGDIRDGDIILVTDFWNPAVIQMRYMIDMAGVGAKIAGIAHAGAYDPQDRLAAQLGDRRWVKAAERGIFACYDAIFFATQFHLDLFHETHNPLGTEVIAGFPMEYIVDQIDACTPLKENLVLFAQRNAPEKQPELFYELADWSAAQGLPYDFVDVGSMGLSKADYQAYLAKSKLVVSFALQETLGITPMEALSRGCDILVPDRLSYSEMYTDEFKYKGGNAVADLNAVKAELTDRMENFETRKNSIRKQYNTLAASFFSSTRMIEVLKDLK